VSLIRFGACAMSGWTETCRGIVSPWECDVTEHFTIAYYFDRLADAASTIAESLGLREVSRAVGRRFDIRFARELRAGASFHILSGPTALDERSIRFAHQLGRLRQW
jgi:acyl-CoA thioesterase FadM